MASSLLSSVRNALLLCSAVAAAPAAAETLGSQPAWQSKSAAILGGMSALERIAAAQGGVPVAPVAAPAQFSATLEPAAGPYMVDLKPDVGFLAEAAPVSADRPDIFGSVALAVTRTPLDNQWRRAASASFDRSGPWSDILASAEALTPAERVAMVNLWVNRSVEFVDDSVQYSRRDHWVDAAQSLRRGRGDCEDYALAKMQLLRAAGIPEDDMYLSVVKDLVRRADHAVLIVRLDGRFLVLDNNTDRLVDASAAQDYRPVFTYGAAGSWTHGYVRPVSPVQAAGGFRLASSAR